MSRLQQPHRPRRWQQTPQPLHRPDGRGASAAWQRAPRQSDPVATLGLVATLSLAAMTSGCADEHDGFSSGLKGTLEMEIRDHATVEIARGRSSAESTVRLTSSESYGLVPAGSPLEAPGRIEAFSEANATLYTARFSAPAQTDGPCGAEPVSLALSLHRQGENAMVVGGLSAYCGEQVWHGRPKRILRLSGELK